jgi:predicted ATPase/DNA-binding CsgD family transcriptional regulator
MFGVRREIMLHRMVLRTAVTPRRPAPPVLRMSGRYNWPVSVTPLIGRDSELGELADLLRTERVLTLTGSGGCGKTRLAAELASRAAERFPGGIVWVELAASSDLEGVVTALSSALDVVESPGETVLGGVVRELGGRGRALLVLDNAEHLLAAAADVVSTITSRVGGVSVLCTSRELIGVPGEVVWRVPSLGVPPREGIERLTAAELMRFDAAVLFEERARRSRRGFVVTDANAAAVAQICVRLDGVPLAIELAAARVRSMPPERIAALLDDRFRLLSGGPRTLVARQQTLQASVTWSEELLDNAERAVFRRLGVFVGGFTIEAAEAVVGSFADVDTYEIADVVGRLVDKSLVQFEDIHDDHDGRYSLLETIRSYAAQRLFDVGEMAQSRDAHAEWCATWLAAASGDDQVSDVNAWWEARVLIVGRIDPEWPNCAAALEWAVPGTSLSLRLVAGLGDYWALRQRASDSGRYGMPAVRAGEHHTPEWMSAILALQAVRINAADAQFGPLRDDAIRLAIDRDDEAALLRLEVGRHVAMVMLAGPRDDVLAAVDDVRSRAYDLGEWYTAWNATQSPAVMLVVAGRPGEAELRVAELTSARALLIRALAAQTRGEMAFSSELAAQAQSMLDERFGGAMDRTLVAFRAGAAALAAADRSILDSLRLAEVSTDSLPGPFLSAYAVAHGVNELLEGRVAEARATFAAVEPDYFHSWRSVCYLAEIELSLGDSDAARDAALRLRAAVAEVSAPLYEATSDLVLGECARPHDLTAALDLAHQSLATAAEFGLWPSAVDALEAIGSMLFDLGRPRDAARILAAAQAARGSMGYRYRYPHRQAYVRAVQDAVRADDGWEEGLALSLPGAVEVAQRMRGERLRPLVGWDSLTPTELRVVEQVAAGLTNPQIAETLLMSRATVKTHLVHVYAKLALRNRSELAAAAARREAP